MKNIKSTPSPADRYFQDQYKLRKSMRVALIIGIGIMAAIDEIVFHQLLAWHHFYDKATPAISLLSDGILHAAELIAIVAGFFMYADLKRQQLLNYNAAWAGFLIGAGAFQLFDGIVDHKVFRVHQVRYNVELLPYDLAWNAFGVILLFIGFFLWKKSKQHLSIK